MMLRQEAALDRSIDRKVRILLRLRKELTNPPVAPPDRGDGPTVGNMEDTFDSNIASDNSQSVRAVEDLKLNEQHGNVCENKGSRFKHREQSRNTTQNKGGYTLIAGMLLKRKELVCRR
jgi:hypothetical protein